MERIDTLNQRLIDYYGLDSNTGQALFRIVWANEETEMRRVRITDNAIELLFSEVREVKKYPYMKDMYVLEQLVVVPDVDKDELPSTKLSYEPLWAYCDNNRTPLPPTWPATQFIVDTLYAALGKKSLAKYVDSEKNTTKEGREQRITELQRELFEDETDVGDALRYKEGIVVPSNYKKES